MSLIDLTQNQGVLIQVTIFLVVLSVSVYRFYKTNMITSLIVFILLNISFLLQYSLYQYTTETLPHHTYSLISSKLNLVEVKNKTLNLFNYDLISSHNETINSVKLDCGHNSFRICMKIVAENIDTVDYYLYSPGNHLKRVVVDSDLNFSLEL